MSTGTNVVPDKLVERFWEIRKTSAALCEPLEIEDFVVQSMPDVSPPKWSLAHTTWFFETFLLQPFLSGYKPVDPLYAYLFNSYYEQIGARHPRPHRGLLTRPTVRQVLRYRGHVDTCMSELLATALRGDAAPEIVRRVEIGLQHEQQHQELLLMDLKHILSHNPSYPVYRAAPAPERRNAPALAWQHFDAGQRRVGFRGDGFRFDNEVPAHDVYLQAFSIANRCVTNGEWLEWIDSGGYERPEFWMADGWARVQEENWKAPLYWRQIDGEWHEYTLSGLERVNPDAPVVHVSWYEADAMSRARGGRLPSEFEWEVAAADAAPGGNFLEDGVLHPRPAAPAAGLQQMLGDVWELTRSAYCAYPGYRAEPGALGEYNSKFMIGQMVLRGGCCVTPKTHIRGTYRNFFYPHMRWPFQGLRLARDVG